LGPLTEKLAVKFTPVFVANSQHGAEFMIREFLVDPARLHIIHNGVQLARAQGNRETWRNSLAVDDSCFLACMVANLQMYKDHVTLLKAWRIVVDRLRSLNREAVLLLAGRFDETHDRLKALAYDLDLGSSVRFLGSVKDVTGLLEAVDIGVHSSVNEGCPNGVLECMAAGLAVVGTNYAGIREALGSGYEFLAEPGDAAGFAEQVIRLAQDPRARREAGEANALRIGAEFQPEHMYQKMVALIAEALHALPAATPISTGAAMLAENHEGR
jgi:glycosyltransferase involved in cell wall biosynthesis